MDDTSPSATATLQSTRARLRAVVAPEPPPTVTPTRAFPGAPAAGVSWLDSVVEGAEQWWRKSTAGRAVTVLGPMAEPYLRPLARRHYRALLLTSAATGALVGHYPVRSLRTVLRIAGPLLVSGVILEIGKAGLRRARGKPPVS